jgi:hypothetical protein
MYLGPLRGSGKKENQTFLIYKGIQKGLGANMTNGLLIY